MTAQEDRPLWERMREAAAVLSEVSSELDPCEVTAWCTTAWSSVMLHTQATKWEQEALEAADRDQLIDDVAAQLYRSHEWIGQGGLDWTALAADSIIRQRWRNTATYLLNMFDVSRLQAPF